MSRIVIIDRCPDCKHYGFSQLNGDHFCSHPVITKQDKWSRTIATQHDNYKGEIPDWCPLEDKK